MKKNFTALGAAFIAVCNAVATGAFLRKGYPPLAGASIILTIVSLYVTVRLAHINQGSSIMTMSDLRPKNIGLGKLTACIFLFALIIAFVAETLFQDYVFDLGFSIFGVSIDALVYVFAIAALGYKVQQWLSQAYGGRRVVDTLVSIVMLVIIAAAVATWTKFPVVQMAVAWVTNMIGYPINTTPTGYKIAIALIFGSLALLDVLGRDILGIGRRSSGGQSWSLGGVHRESLVSGAHGNLPDATEELGSRSGSPLYRVTGDAVIDLNWWVKHPVTGELIPVKNVPDRLKIRAIEHVVSEPPTPPAPPPAS